MRILLLDVEEKTVSLYAKEDDLRLSYSLLDYRDGKQNKNLNEMPWQWMKSID